MTLSMVQEGKKVRIVKIGGGWMLKKRFHDLGLYEGTEVEVVRNDITAGPLILKVLDSRIGIGRGQANSIMVE